VSFDQASGSGKALCRFAGSACGRVNPGYVLGNHEEYFIIVSLCVVSRGLRAMHSHLLQRSYVERGIFITIGLLNALFVDRPTGKLIVVSTV
jgi:hypothetical protein